MLGGGLAFLDHGVHCMSTKQKPQLNSVMSCYK